MGVRRIGIAAAMYDRQFAILEQALESGHARIQAEMLVENPQTILG